MGPIAQRSDVLSQRHHVHAIVRVAPRGFVFSTHGPALPVAGSRTRCSVERFADFDITGALCVFAPGATPRDAVERLSTEIVRAVRLPEVSNGMLRDGFMVIAVGSAQYEEFLRAKLQQVQKLGKATNVKLD